MAAVLLAVLVTYVLGRVGGPTPQWERLSFIATVAGAAFTMAAVAGIAVGVVTLRQSAEAQRLQAEAQELQAKAHRAAVEQAIRATHNDLLKMAIDQPLLDAVWGGPADPRLADDDPGAQAYANMIVAFWQMAYHGGVSTDAEVRLGARAFFTGRIGRAFWAGARADRAEAVGDDVEHRFHEVVDAEYQAALREPPAPDEPLRASVLAAVPPQPVRGAPVRAAVAGSAAGAVTGAVFGYLIGRSAAEPSWKRRRHR